MKLKLILSLYSLSLSSFCLFASNNLDCADTISSVFHKDSTQSVFRYFGSALDMKTRSCNSFILDISKNKKLDLSNVFEMKLYIQSSKNQTMKISFSDRNSWTQEASFQINNKTGYNSIPLSVYANKKGVDLKSIVQIKISFEENTESKVDELEFLYEEEKPIEQPKGLDPKRMKDVEKDFESKNEKQNQAAENRDRKELNLR